MTDTTDAQIPLIKGAGMQDNANVSIDIGFEGSQPEAADAARALTGTLKGATYLQRVSIETRAPERAHQDLHHCPGAGVDGLRISAEPFLVISLLNLTMQWFKDHKKRNAMTLTIACNNSTVITQTVAQMTTLRVCWTGSSGTIVVPDPEGHRYPSTEGEGRLLPSGAREGASGC